LVRCNLQSNFPFVQKYVFIFKETLKNNFHTITKKNTQHNVGPTHQKFTCFIFYFFKPKKLEHENNEGIGEAGYQKAVPFETQGTGLEPSLNWSLSPLHIHPQYEAFGNASLKNILKTTYGELDSQKQNLTVEAFPVPKYQKYALKQEKKYEFEKDVEDFSEVYAKRLLKEVIQFLLNSQVGYHMSTVPTSFVQDSNVGSFQGDSSNVRVVTDNSVSALFLRNLLFKMPKNRLATSFTYEGSVVHAPCYQFTDPKITGLKKIIHSTK
jgi:hypothetical protein